MAGSDIFISYSRQDRSAAQLFATSLVQQGFAVWWDDNLHSGETFDEVIEEQLRSSKAVVVLWSPRSAASRWVRAEATVADRRRKLVPVIIEPCDRPIIFELTHTIDLSHWTGDGSDPTWQIFLNDLCRLTGKAPAKVTAHPLPPEQRKALPLDKMPASHPLTSAVADVDDEEEYNPTQAFAPMYEKEFIARLETHCLELTQTGSAAMRFAIEPDGTRIGRTKPADIILVDPQISRMHCKLELVCGEMRVTDLNSTNGTFIDGTKVLGDAALPVGSTLTIGQFDLVYQIRTPAEV